MAEMSRFQYGRFGRFVESWTGMGRPVPVPPQLLQAILPDPEQVRHPTSPSDQREHMQATRPVPLQVGHRWKGPAMGFWSMTDLTRTAPASMLRPSWVSTIGPMAGGASPESLESGWGGRRAETQEEKRKISQLLWSGGEENGREKNRIFNLLFILFCGGREEVVMGSNTSVWECFGGLWKPGDVFLL